MASILGPVDQIGPQDPLWPAALCELDSPPALLHMTGKLPSWPAAAVAIVGTRRADARALQYARQLAGELARAGCIVVSGGASGIDSAAHQGALDAGGTTIAILGTPLESPYPLKNVPLFRQITERGCVLSELAEGATMYPARFLERNRLIAALSRVVVVVQAPMASGALSTASYAKRLGRAVLVVPHGPWEPRGEGCLALLAQGAGICRTAADVLSIAALGTSPELPRRRRRPKKSKEIQGLDEDEQQIVSALRGAALSADELCEVTGLSAPRAQRALLMLMLSQVIHEEGSGRYARSDYP